MAEQEITNILPPPTDLSRQVGISSPLARSISTASSVSELRTPDEAILSRLITYRYYLEHERDFVDREIQTLITNNPGSTRQEQEIFLQLREQLKIRFNAIVLKLSRTNALIDLLV